MRNGSQVFIAAAYTSKVSSKSSKLILSIYITMMKTNCKLKAFNADDTGSQGKIFRLKIKKLMSII